MFVVCCPEGMPLAFVVRIPIKTAGPSGKPEGPVFYGGLRCSSPAGSGIYWPVFIEDIGIAPIGKEIVRHLADRLYPEAFFGSPPHDGQLKDEAIGGRLVELHVKVFGRFPSEPGRDRKRKVLVEVPGVGNQIILFCHGKKVLWLKKWVCFKECNALRIP